MPYTINYSPAPLTFTIRPRLNWRLLLSVVWLCFIAYRIFLVDLRPGEADDNFEIIILAFISLGVCLSFFRRERIEFYPDQIIWRTTWFGFTRSKVAPLADVLGAEWNEAEQRGGRSKRQDYVEFFLPAGSIKACYGLKFEEFDRMREEIRSMYPDLIKRWGQSSSRSQDLTLLNLN